MRYFYYEKEKPPVLELCNGWSFFHYIPVQLSRLNKYESLIISLRLPVIFVWRSQGGFGQYASYGTPVAFNNQFANLVSTLPRDPKIILRNILQNGMQVKISSYNVKCALEWLIENNVLRKRRNCKTC